MAPPHICENPCIRAEAERDGLGELPSPQNDPRRLVIVSRRHPSTAVAPLRLVPHPRAAAGRAS